MKKKALNDTTEWSIYRKKNQLEKKTKIFICPAYHSFKEALLERGWHENTDRNSEIFDLKFMIKKNDLYKPKDEDGNKIETTLYDFQTVNHFLGNGVLTSKVGLCQSL
jgi:hypothetical protein